jgi:DNA-binding NtrC family response regulator
MLSVLVNPTREIDAPLPAASAALSERPRVPATSPNISVWLVDDNDHFRHTLADLLGRMGGIQCSRHFSSPDAVLSTLASQMGTDVILLDVHMRDRNGLDAIGAIKALSRNTQVLMLTSMYDSGCYDRAIAEGASDFLLKSYSPEQIIERIHNPRRRINARRCRPTNTGCTGTGLRTAARSANSSLSLFKGRFRFLRELLS